MIDPRQNIQPRNGHMKRPGDSVPAGDLSKGPIPDFSTTEGGQLEDCLRLFRWAESEALNAYSWYLREKERKSRASKILRILAVCMLTMGAVLPPLSLLTDKAVKPEWGYILLATGGGAVLMDRGFGFSASWVRYVKTSSAISSRIARQQMEWTVWRIGIPTPSAAECAEFAEASIRPFLLDIQDLIEAETNMWASTLGDHLTELQGILPTPKAR
jgi:hypothetical protein